MFSADIVASDAFLEMPTSTRELYFQLGMYADDDGFVNPKKIMRMVGASDDDLKVLLGKRFLLLFQSGVVVIKHWLIHNLIRADLYKETLYKTEKASLGLNDNGGYTELRVGVAELKPVEAPKWLKIRRKELRTADVPKTALRLGKDRLGQGREGKESIDNTIAETSSAEVVKIIDAFKEVNPSYQKWFANKTQRLACERLLKVNGLDRLLKVIGMLNQSNTKEFFPVITNPIQLEDKFAQLATAWQKFKNNQTVIL